MNEGKPCVEDIYDVIDQLKDAADKARARKQQAKKKEKPSPLPWTQHSDTIKSANEVFVARCIPDADDDDAVTAEANAALIVSSVNMRPLVEKLVEEVRYLLARVAEHEGKTKLSECITCGHALKETVKALGAVEEMLK
ncbi:MAG TPA: hypothetical protein VGN17_05065 [Bryobacteraceae bacterium]|jgi:hypothetical protein